MLKINIIGAGLAGSEATYQLAKRGIKVHLYEMRPVKMTPAHQTAGFAELICSNSLRAASIENAVGLLKEEMRRMDSLIIRAADATKVEAGGALAVDRELFSKYITEEIKNNSNIYIYVNNSSLIYQLNLNGKYFDCLKNEKLEDKIIVKPYSFGIFTKD